MESFFSSLSGRIVCILAILIVIFGIAFAVNMAKGVSGADKSSEESEQVAASVTSSSEETGEPITEKTLKLSDGKEEKGETGEQKPAKEYKEVGAREGESKTEYLQRTCEVLNVINVSDSTDVMTEAEVMSFLNDRGFGDCQVTYDFMADGTCVGDVAVDSNSTKMHPEYSFTYFTPNEDAWIVYVINGDIVAYPISYLLNYSINAPTMLSESTKITSYCADTHQFLEVVPEESEVIIMTVPRIDAETLNNITSEEINKL